jgi:hypothetical protein
MYTLTHDHADRIHDHADRIHDHANRIHDHANRCARRSLLAVIPV